MKDNLLEQAISLYKSGNIKSAGEVLKNLVRQDPKNEAAWLWLSVCVEKNEQKQYCLQRVLEINPENRDARTALQMLIGPATPKVEEILATRLRVQNQTSQRLSSTPTIRPPKQKKKRNRVVVFFAFLGFLVLVFACFLSVANNQTSTQNTINSQSATQQPTEVKSLVVKAGTLSQYESQIQKDTVVNVYKKNGTLDEREDDLKQLCLDWLFYRAKIMEYASSGNSAKADEARASFSQINQWLDAYNEDDVQTMNSIIEKNKWSNW